MLTFPALLKDALCVFTLVAQPCYNKVWPRLLLIKIRLGSISAWSGSVSSFSEHCACGHAPHQTPAWFWSKDQRKHGCYWFWLSGKLCVSETGPTSLTEPVYFPLLTKQTNKSAHGCCLLCHWSRLSMSDTDPSLPYFVPHCILKAIFLFEILRIMTW